MSKLESELRDHALTLIHQDYLLVEKQIQGLSERISIELNLISESARQIPDNINKSLTNIADALEDAEKTASNLSNEARQAILAIKESEIDAIRREIFTGVKTEMDKTQEVAENIRKTLLSYPDAFRPKAPVATLLIFSVILMTSIIASSMFSWSMYKQNDETHRALLTLDYKYMQQEKVIQTLPAEYRNKFPK